MIRRLGLAATLLVAAGCATVVPRASGELSGRLALRVDAPARSFSADFDLRGDQPRAIEELVAELGAAFLCAELAVSPTPRQDHAAYLAHWLQVLKADNRAIFAAASMASEAAGYVLACGVADAPHRSPCVDPGRP